MRSVLPVTTLALFAATVGTVGTVGCHVSRRPDASDANHGAQADAGGAPHKGGGGRAGTAVSRAVRPPTVNTDALPAASGDLPSDARALQVVDGRERTVDAQQALRAGLTLIDLSDGWAPALFADGVARDGTPLPNHYRAVFVGLANDRTDGDGQPLPAGEKNYLELLGIPPSLSVMRGRFVEDAKRDCGAIDAAILLAVNEIPTWGATTEQKEIMRHQARAKRLTELTAGTGATGAVNAGAAGTGGPPTVAGAIDARLVRELKAHARFAAERAAFTEVEKRVTCEGLLSPAHHTAGRYDTAMRTAVFNFQQKHAVLAQGDLNRATLEALATPPLTLDFAALKRVMTERVAHAGGVLEDGSALGAGGEAATYPAADGARHPVPNLTALATDALMSALDLVNPDDAVRFFARHGAADFRRLRVPIRFPPLPEYYQAGANLDLSAEIDRGDVWYDFPFDAKGNRVPQPREHYPSFTLYAKYRGERVPLVRWRTTIGGWRSELASDGQEYYSFKISDVGPRLWRHIVAAPVWIPPVSSPLGSMVKEKRVNGAFVKVTNYDESGPGYLSAYGLVAAIHESVRRGPDGPTYGDNGIRTHGSFDYLSLRGRFSHGCHRLYNNLAVRLFSFVIRHRNVRPLGQVALNFRRTFWWGGDLYDLRLPTRGFYFQLDPPVPVETLEGRIRGARQTPVVGFVRKPGVKYVTDKIPLRNESPESKAAGGGEP